MKSYLGFKHQTSIENSKKLSFGNNRATNVNNKTPKKIFVKPNIKTMVFASVQIVCAISFSIRHIFNNFFILG